MVSTFGLLRTPCRKMVVLGLMALAHCPLPPSAPHNARDLIYKHAVTSFRSLGSDIDLPFDPAIPLLGIYPTDCDTGYSRGT
jgi:hypothetical protein